MTTDLFCCEWLGSRDSGSVDKALFDRVCGGFVTCDQGTSQNVGVGIRNLSTYNVLQIDLPTYSGTTFRERISYA